MLRRTDDIMVLLNLWNSMLFMLTTVRTTGSTVSGTEKDIMHAIAGNPFIIRTWPMNGSTLYFTLKKDNNIILDMSMVEGIDRNSTVQNGRMMLIYNQTIRELTLLFENVSKEDGGIYEVKESFYKTNTISDESEADTYDRKDDTWYLEIYVLGPGEIKQGYVGGNISMEFEFAKSAKQSTLYNYDEHSALLAGSTCSVLTDSSLYGRLRCATDNSGRMYMITIVNISQRDAGLYKLATGRNEAWRFFFSIEDSPTCAVVGDNMTIGWFYNQQGMKRTLRVIHPNQGVMMLLHQTNYPQIKSNFHHRLVYNGDILQSFMLFTLLSVTQSDAGLYTIETLHGNTIPGSKELNVEGTCTTGGGIQTTLHDVTKKVSDNKQEVVMVQPTARQSERRNVSSRLNDDAVQASLEVMDYSQPISETIAPSVTSSSTEIPNTLSISPWKCLDPRLEPEIVITRTFQVLVPAYVFPVTIVVFAVMNLTVCFLLWIRRKKSRTIDAERRQVLAKCDTDLYITPIASERPLLIPPNEDVRMDHTNASQNSHVETSMEVLPMDCSPCMDGYEMIRISSNDDFQKTFHNKENNAKLNESSITPFLDASDYLTVEFVMESAV